MILSLSFQAELFLTTIVMGFTTAFAYDILKVFRLAIKHKKIFVHMEDAFYWLWVVLVVFFVLLNESFGEIRGFCVGGVFMGMILYFLSISKIFLRFSQAIINVIKKSLILLLEIVFTPFRLLFKVFGAPCKKKVKNLYKFLKKRLIIIKLYVKIYTKRSSRNRAVLSSKKHKEQVNGKNKSETKN